MNMNEWISLSTKCKLHHVCCLTKFICFRSWLICFRSLVRTVLASRMSIDINQIPKSTREGPYFYRQIQEISYGNFQTNFDQFVILSDQPRKWLGPSRKGGPFKFCTCSSSSSWCSDFWGNSFWCNFKFFFFVFRFLGKQFLIYRFTHFSKCRATADDSLLVA